MLVFTVIELILLLILAPLWPCGSYFEMSANMTIFLEVVLKDTAGLFFIINEHVTQMQHHASFTQFH